MTKSHEAISSDGPALFTLEQAREDLRQKAADFVPNDTEDRGFSNYEDMQHLLTNPQSLQIYVDIYNKVVLLDWERQREEIDRSMVDQWVAEGGADLSD